MSDAFFEKVFGGSEPGDFGAGWISGAASIFFGVLGFGGAARSDGKRMSCLLESLFA